MDRNEISKYRYFDTHTHVYDPELMENFGTLNDACIKQGILIAVIGVDLATSNQAVTISQGCSNAIATAGIHPLEIKPRTYQEDLNNFQIFLTKNIQNISAIGEVGLDYHYKNIDPEIQKIVFIKMIETAIKYKKPIILHVREAYEDCFNILLNYQHQLEKILIHCYDTNAEWVKKFNQFNCFYAIGGKITYPEADYLREALRTMPRNRIVSETDCPYLCPEPERKGINSPLNIIPIVEKINAVVEEDLTDQLLINALNFFNLN